MSTDKRDTLLALCASPLFVGLSALLATVPLYSPNITEIYELQLQTPILPAIIPCMMIGAIIAGILCVVAPEGALHKFARCQLAVRSVAFCYTLLIVVFWVMAAYAPSIPHELLRGLGAAFGLSLGIITALYLMLWLGILSQFSIKESLVLFSCALACAAVCHGVMMHVPLPLRSFGYCLLAALSSWYAARHGDSVALTVSLVERYAPASPNEPPVSVLRQAAGMAQVLFIPFLGLLLFAFLMGVRRFTLFDGVQVEFVGVLIACALTVGISKIPSHRPLLQLILYLIIPGCALVIMLGNTFGVGSVIQWFAAWFSYVFFAMVAQIAFSGIIGMAHAREFSVVHLAGLTVACFATASLLGVEWGSAITAMEHEGGPFLLVISGVYFTVSIASALRHLWREGESNLDEKQIRAAQFPLSHIVWAQGEMSKNVHGQDEPTQVKSSQAMHPNGALAQGVLSQDLLSQDEMTQAGVLDALKDACEHIAQTYKLSRRESEVFVLMARGHSVTYIASEFVLSESTVRTHVKSIYRKLGINSKEELFALVDKG